MDDPRKIVAITGPTATGKTALAVKLADKFNGEIVSIDSRQVYKGMDIGTGKDLAEYMFNNREIKSHLVDIVDPNYPYNLKEFYVDAWQALNKIVENGNLPILCGGSALYLDAILSNYELAGAPPDMEWRKHYSNLSLEELLQLLKKTNSTVYNEFKDKDNRNRVLRVLEKIQAPQRKTKVARFPLDALILGVYYPRSEVRERIEKRLDARLDAGMIEEVKQLHVSGVSWERLEFLGLEYRYIAKFLQGELSHKEMRDNLLIKIRQFAKRQDIWFRKMERSGKQIHWLPAGDTTEANKLINLFLSGKKLPKPEFELQNINYGNSALDKDSRVWD